MRTKILVLLAAAVVGATALMLVSGAGAVTNLTIGNVTCPLTQYNPTHFKLQTGQTVTCTISNTGLPDGTVTVTIQSSELGNTEVTGTVSGGTITFTFTGLANGCNTSIITYGTGSDKVNTHVGFGYVDSSGTAIVCGSTPPAQNLTGTKDATPSFNRSYTWHIHKAVDKTSVENNSGSATFNYTVTVNHDPATDSGWTVTGAVHVSNPNAAAVTGVNISDAINDANASCVVTGVFPATLAPSSVTDFPYTCTYSSAPSSSSETNTATITWTAQVLDNSTALTAGSTTATAGVNWTVSPTLIDNCVSVSDPLDLGSPHAFCVGDTGDPTFSFTYSHDFTGDPAGTCTKHDNTATFTTNTTATHGSDSQEVTVCVGKDLTVSKTANPSFNRSYTWHIHKAVDKTSVENNSGSATFNYTVTVNHDPAVDSGWQVKGTITVHNPNDWEAITFNLSDAIDNGGVCTITGGGSSLTLAASATQTYNYTCTYASAPNPASGTNTATATWNKATYFTPGGTASGTASADFGAVTPTTTDECVSVTDPIDPNSPHAFCVGDPGDPTFSFTYSTTLTAPAGQCSSLDNTATFTTNDTKTTGSDSKTVQYCNFNAPLTIGYWKTHIRVCGAHEKTGTGGCNNNGPFTVAYLPQHLGSFLVPGNDSGATALAVFNANNCGASTSQGAVACLAAQLLAAKLNVANGANTCINATIASADAFLILVGYTGPTGTYTLTAAQRATAISLKTKLDTYNNGGGC